MITKIKITLNHILWFFFILTKIPKGEDILWAAMHDQCEKSYQTGEELPDSSTSAPYLKLVSKSMYSSQLLFVFVGRSSICAARSRDLAAGKIWKGLHCALWPTKNAPEPFSMPSNNEFSAACCLSWPMADENSKFWEDCTQCNTTLRTTQHRRWTEVSNKNHID